MAMSEIESGDTDELYGPDGRVICQDCRRSTMVPPIMAKDWGSGGRTESASIVSEATALPSVSSDMTLRELKREYETAERLAEQVRAITGFQERLQRVREVQAHLRGD